MISHETSLSKFKRIDITQFVFSNNSGIKLEINNNKKKKSTTDKNFGNPQIYGIETTHFIITNGSNKNHQGK